MQWHCWVPLILFKEHGGEKLESVWQKSVVHGRRRKQVISSFDKLFEHRLKEPHWYLKLFGVDPEYQGAGLGSLLLNHIIQISEKDGLPIFLFTSKEDNLGLLWAVWF